MAENPFQSHYGSNWETKISALRGFISINSLIDHMFREAKEIMRGTVHHDDYVVYHDALSLMTGRGAVEYMQKKLLGKVSTSNEWGE